MQILHIMGHIAQSQEDQQVFIADETGLVHVFEDGKLATIDNQDNNILGTFCKEGKLYLIKERWTAESDFPYNRLVSKDAWVTDISGESLNIDAINAYMYLEGDFDKDNKQSVVTFRGVWPGTGPNNTTQFAIYDEQKKLRPFYKKNTSGICYFCGDTLMFHKSLGKNGSFVGRIGTETLEFLWKIESETNLPFFSAKQLRSIDADKNIIINFSLKRDPDTLYWSTNSGHFF